MITSQKLDILRELFDCPSLEIDLRSEWGAEHVNARAEIRRAISARTLEDASDLKTPPLSKNFSLSVAHCPGAGGFALVQKQRAIGLDIEAVDRIRDSIVMRISGPEEFSAAPTAAHLWAAKEAAFKALHGPLQPQTLSEVLIVDWQKLEGKMPEAWRFRVSLNLTADLIEGFGVVFRDSPLVISLFCLDSST